MVSVKPYMKAVVAVLGAVLAALAAAITDDVITEAEWLTLGVALLTALGVYLVPNRPPEP